MDLVRALGWRLRRHSLDPVAAPTATDVLDRVLALRGWPEDSAALAVGLRLASPDPGEVGPALDSGELLRALDAGELLRALDSGELLRSYAFRGGSYVFTPEVAALVLSARTVTRAWETRRWQHQGGFELDDWEPLREAVCAALADGPLTRTEISARLAETDLRHLADAARGRGADSLYKPLHWWGDICFGPNRDGASTFRLLRGDPRWPGLADIDDAGPALIRRYLHSYGPATPENLAYWLTEGLGVPRRRLERWLASLGDELVTESVDGQTAYLLLADRDGVHAAEPSRAVRFLPAYDPWVLGPGTADGRIVPPSRRARFSQGAHPVVWRGVVSGTWRLQGDAAIVEWFGEAGDPPLTDLDDGVQRLAKALTRELTAALVTA